MNSIFFKFPQGTNVDDRLLQALSAQSGVGLCMVSKSCKHAGSTTHIVTWLVDELNCTQLVHKP